MGKDKHSETHSIYSYLSATHKVWDPFKFSDQEEFSVSEVWHDAGESTYETVNRSIYNYDLSLWLDETSAIPRRGPKCILRAVWVTAQTKHCININEETFGKLIEAFDHELAQKSLPSAYASIACLTESTGGSSYVHGNFPKITATWSKPSSGPVGLVCIGENAKLDILRDLLSSSFIQELAHHELSPGLMCSLLYSREVDQRLEDVKKLVREVESRTGYHDFENRNELPARGNLFSLAAKMSGAGTKMASHVRKMGILEELNRFVESRAQSPRQDKQRAAAGEQIVANVRVLEQRVALQKIDAGYVQCRVQTQRDALFHLIAENDAAASIEMAQDSKTLALASRRDSASMKSLAIVSMLFLPGTFVSSLFGMPLFDWGPEVSLSEAQKLEVWGPRLGVFLGVTAPLMLLTFAIWTLWMSRQREKGEAKFKTAEVPSHVQLDDEIPPSEVKALALKQVNSGLSETDFGASSPH